MPCDDFQVPEFDAYTVRELLSRIGFTTLLIELGSPWENSYIENLIARLRDELLGGENLLKV